MNILNHTIAASLMLCVTIDCVIYVEVIYIVRVFGLGAYCSSFVMYNTINALFVVPAA